MVLAVSISTSDHVSRIPTKAESSSSQPHGAIERFRLNMTGISGSEALERAWNEFEILRVSEALSQLSDDELAAFAKHAYNASRLSINEPKALSKEFAIRIGRLHDEFQHRSERDSQNLALRTWSNVLAAQTFILAGRLDKATRQIAETFVASRGKVVPQQITFLQQLFLASTWQSSLQDGLTVLARSWFWIRDQFQLHSAGQDDEMRTAAEELRRTVASAFGAVENATALLQTIEDRVVQEVGTCIFPFVYGTQGSADQAYALYREFVTRGLSMPLEAHLRFFTVLLSKGAYTFAYVMRKNIHSQFPNRQAKQELRATLALFPDLGPPEKDSLCSKAQSAAKARFSSLIQGSSSSLADLLSVWQELELSDSLSQWDTRHKKHVFDDDILAFARLVIDSSRASLDANGIQTPKAFADLLDRIIEELVRRNRHCRTARALLWHSLTLKEDLHTVGGMLVNDSLAAQANPAHVKAVTQFFLAGLRLHTLHVAFELFVPLWPIMIRHLDDAAMRFQGQMREASGELRSTVFRVFENIRDPSSWVAALPDTPKGREVAAHLFLVLFRERGDADSAAQVFDELQARGLHVSYEAHILLLKTFLRARTYDNANRVHTSLKTLFPERTGAPESRGKDELHTVLRLFALQGDTEQAEECFSAMKARGFVDGGARRRLLHAYAVNGRTERANELFLQFFPPGNQSSPKPDTRDFREVIYAHVRAGDLNGINHWLDQMVNASIVPDLSIYNMILQAFAVPADLESASAVLVRMYENGIKPDRISYTTVISIMADRKDPVAAEQLYQRATDEGVQPDDVMTLALMNAHVEAGSWQGVIRAFDYLQQSRHRSKRHTSHIYNTLLKAYVLIGAPFGVVLRIFRRFETLGLEPTEHTYALLVQSACDSGRMDVARDLFVQLDTVPLRGGAKSQITAYIMTIIMAGFLRAGDKERAKAVYNDMQARGIQPTAVTFGVIVQSYANDRSEESLQIAEDFMRSLLDAEESRWAWMGSARGGRSKALESVFGPLMAIYGRELDIAAVERQFDAMIAAGGQPTLIALTMLMDAYRRVDNIEGAQQMWAEIVEVALRISQSDVLARLPSPRAPPRPQRQANILCLPLSVYIAALSAAGRHVAIATTWRDLRARGFAFDAHNWNHLAAALVRAGEPERAFEIVERVLVPYQLQTRRLVRARRRDPATPLTFVGEREPESESGREPEVPRVRRARDVRSATREEGTLTLTPPEDAAADAAQPLHELQQLSLAWQGWRTHNATMDALARALRRLEAGLRVRAVGEDIPAEEDPRRMSAEDAAVFYARERWEAGETLRRIYQKYSNAVGLVQRRALEVQRLWDK